jgi:hypothetical protein
VEVHQHTRYTNIARVHFVSESRWNKWGFILIQKHPIFKQWKGPAIWIQHMNQPIPEPIFPSSKKIRFLHALLWNPPNTFFYLDKNNQCKPSHLASLIITGYSERPNTTATCLEIITAFVCQLSLWRYMLIRHKASSFQNFPMSVDIWKDSLYKWSACHKACTSTRQQKCWHTSFFHVEF